MAPAAYRDFLGDGPAARVLREFSRRVSENLFARSWDFFQQYRREGGADHPLREGGAALKSTLAAAVAGVTPVHLSAVPAALTGRARPARAERCDLWCRYRGADLLVDIDQCGLTLDRGRKAEMLRPAWKGLLAPLEAAGRAKAFAWTERGARVAFLVVYPHSGRAGLERTWDAAARTKLAATVERALAGSLAFLATWQPPKDMRLIHPGGGEGAAPEFCPVVLIAGAAAPVGAFAAD